MKYSDKKLIFGIRPEDIHSPEYLPSGIIASPVSAEVDVIEMMGNEVYLHLINGGKSFLARVDPRSKFRPSEHIKVVFEMANMHAFDFESGKTILLQ